METIEHASVDAGQEELNCWAYIEIFGHHRVAGRVTTRKLGTEVMFQVDVPKGATEFSRSELYSPKSIFSIKPTTEEWCRKFNEHAAKMQHDVLPYVPETAPPQLTAGQTEPDYCPECHEMIQDCICGEEDADVVA